MSTRAEIADVIRSVNAARQRSDADFDAIACRVVFAEVERLLEDGREDRALKLVRSWAANSLEELAAR